MSGWGWGGFESAKIEKETASRVEISVRVNNGGSAGNFLIYTTFEKYGTRDGSHVYQLTGARRSSRFNQLPVRDLQSWRGIVTQGIMAHGA